MGTKVVPVEFEAGGETIHDVAATFERALDGGNLVSKILMSELFPDHPENSGVILFVDDIPENRLAATVEDGESKKDKPLYRVDFFRVGEDIGLSNISIGRIWGCLKTNWQVATGQYPEHTKVPSWASDLFIEDGAASYRGLKYAVDNQVLPDLFDIGSQAVRLVTAVVEDIVEE